MSKKTDDFIARYKEPVIRASKGTGIFPSVTMAQMIIESGWGNTVTATKANNFFGIKADRLWHGDKMLFNTPNDAVKQNYFRVYNNAQDSIHDHEEFLIQNSRYKVHGVFAAATPEEQAKDLAASGYAEAKNYDQALISMINAYHLKDLDKEAGMATYPKTMNVLTKSNFFNGKHAAFIVGGATVFAIAAAIFITTQTEKN